MQWIKHDTNANQDAKLKKLRMKYGLEGYGLYWYCIELIAADVDQNNLTFELEHDAEIISFDTGIHIERVNEMMAYMINLGLFESSNNTITCLKLLKRLDQSMTSNKRMRELINKAKSSKNHDSVMTIPDSVMQEENRIEENKDISQQADDSISHVSGIYKATIEKFKPNWALCRTLTEKRKKLIKKSLSVVKHRASEVGSSPIDYLEGLLEAMAMDGFYSGNERTSQKPNGYQWTIDQILHEKQLTNAIDRLSGK